MDRCRGFPAGALEATDHRQVSGVVDITGHGARLELDATDVTTFSGVTLETSVGTIRDGEHIGTGHCSDAMGGAELAVGGATTTKTHRCPHSDIRLLCFSSERIGDEDDVVGVSVGRKHQSFHHLDITDTESTATIAVRIGEGAHHLALVVDDVDLLRFIRWQHQ